MKKVALHNLGCKVNSYETEAMQEMLEENGYEIVPFKEGADIYIINTCTVTNMADRKSRQMLHKAKRMNPDAIVVAAGCYVQAKENDGTIDESIDIIIGNNKKQNLIEILAKYQKQNGTLQKEVVDISLTQEYEELHLNRTTEHTRAYLKVQDGCNQFCSYCIIPYARGRVRSRKLEDVVEEVEKLVENGYQEVVLTGIHLSSYGLDFDKDIDLLSLIQKVHAVSGLGRIRLGSLEPRIITEDFVKAIASLEKVCPHFHLSLQSGCDETLKRMNRRYTTKEYMKSCELLRQYFNNPALTTDVIVGFPGETDEEFEQSKKFIEQVGFYETHIFKYSKRQGTKAATMNSQVDEKVKTLRSNELLKLGEIKKQQYHEMYMNREIEVLIEEEIDINEKKYMVGYTKEYVKIALPVGEYHKNQIVKIIIENHSQIIH